MKFSISTTFLLLLFASIASATPATDNGNQQCSNNVSTKTVTVTASGAVTKTVTVDAGATSKSSAGSNPRNSNNNNNSGKNNNGGTSNVGNNNGKNNLNGTNNVGTSNSGNTTSTTSNTGSKGKNTANKNPQTSLQLDSSVIGSNLAKNGLVSGAEVGQAASLTSTNNFINSCVGKTITNGQQVAAGSCNPVPMGEIPSKTNMIRCKFSSPPNFGTIAPNTPFKVSMGITGLQTGNFVNPTTNYFAAPQQVNKKGQIIGHSHFVIQKINSLKDTTVPDPQVFAFFQGLNAPAVNNKLTVTVTKGLPEGVYRIATINTAANHQPALVPVAQHGSMDDVIYFTVSAKGAAASNSTGKGASSAKNPAAATTSAKNAKATGGSTKNGGKNGRRARRSFIEIA